MPVSINRSPAGFAGEVTGVDCAAPLAAEDVVAIDAGSIINATASIGDGFQSAPSSSPSQFAAGVGIIHRF